MTKVMTLSACALAVKRERKARAAKEKAENPVEKAKAYRLG